MRNIDVKFLRSGHVLADPVANSSGAILCPMGYQLTDIAIQRLKNAGVLRVTIEGNPYSGPSIEFLTDRLEKRFQGIEDPRLLEIKGLIATRIDAIREEYGL